MTRVQCDGSPLRKTLEELASLLSATERPLELFDGVFNGSFDARSCEFEQHGTGGASKLVTRIKAGQRLLKLLMALRTGERKLVYHRSTPYK